MERRLNKRFILFMHLNFYPEGGIKDAVGSFDTVKEAKDYIKTLDNCEDECYVWDKMNDERVHDHFKG